MENKVTFIATVFNESKNIDIFLDSLLNQTKYPNEVVIVDGMSNDGTVEKINNFANKFKVKNINFRLIIKKGNRSIGRNLAIDNATGGIIICSDAGCFLDKDWIRNITKPFTKKEVEVVCGYYRGKYETIFQKCLIPYVLVMPDKVKASNFLPAARSMAFRKSIWRKVGGFPEQFSNNEDYVFAKKLKRTNAGTVFQKDALVYWIPRKNYKEAFIMFFRFAMGDVASGILRPKVAFIFLRYFLGILLVFYVIINDGYHIALILVFLLVAYLIWAIQKNYKYVKDVRAVIFLPVLQIVSDIAVILGSVAGINKIWDIKKTQ